MALALPRRAGAPLRPLLLSTGLLLAAAVALPGGARPARTALPAAQNAPFTPTGAREVVCRWADTPIRIDGEANDAAWKNAPVLDGFGQPWLGKDARAARTATRARLLWDRENLYFHADLEDADLFADITEHDGQTWFNDVLELFLRPADDKPGYYEFQVNAAGTVLDMFLPRRNDGGYDKYKGDGDYHLETKVVLHGTLNDPKDRDRGWSVEGRIPWSDLLRTGGRPAPDERWKFALCRYDYTTGQRPELSSLAPLTQPSFHRYEDYAALRFEGPARDTARPFGIQTRTPLLTSKVAGSPEPPDPYRHRRVYPKLKLTYPVTIKHEPGSDRMLAILQKWPGGPSELIRFRDDPEVDRYESLLTVDRTAYEIAFHPDFARNGYVYLGSKGPLAAESPARQCSIARYTLARRAPYGLDPKSEKTIIEWPSDGHDGAAMDFGKDGMLYITSGDGTSDSDRNVVGQLLDRLTAKVLRIDVDHPEAGRAYSVPKDNPFIGMANVRPETWAYGFRNPWRLTVDRETGDVWVGNNGQDLWETAYRVKRGANYGWSVYEGSHPFYLTRKLGPTPVSKPTVEHPHSEARSLTGGIVYYGSRYPELRGAYVYGDYSTGKIWAVRTRGDRVVFHKEVADTPLQITGFGVDSHGEILIADNQGDGKGAFYTLDPTPKDLPPSHFPRRLSESGLFRSVKGHAVEPGLIPYSVNAPLWSDGAYKERYIALPGADAKIDFTTSRGWGFPDGTVLVKSFALETEEGNPASRRWVETRFLTKQEGEWVGYSYRWNDAQTDATLVSAKGADQGYTVRTASGTRKQAWHYPSRAECMSCHSRAANFVLGLSLVQMNREHDYGGVRDNQLRVLEHLGVLRTDWAGEARERIKQEARARGMTEDQANAYVDRQAAGDGQRQPVAASLLARAPETYPHAVDPSDVRQDLNLRARSYLQGNCAQCHVEAGGGNAQMELEFVTPPEGMRIFGVKPVHDTYDLPNARLIAPGRPESSVLLHRISHREKGHMPPLATSVVDKQAVELLRSWIQQLPR